MTDFTFDTSGFVQVRFSDAGRVFWSDLSPFCQGYVRAAFERALFPFANPELGKLG